MIGAPNSLNLNCKVRVMKEAPGPSVSEEIADIFTNYNIDNKDDDDDDNRSNNNNDNDYNHNNDTNNDNNENDNDKNSSDSMPVTV